MVGYVPGMLPPGVSQKEIEFFNLPSVASQFPSGGSPAAGTGVVGGGPRTSAYFGPTGVQYDTISKGFRDYVSIIDRFNLQRQFTDTQYDKFRDVLGQQLGEVDKGYAEAFGYGDKLGAAARKRAVDRETQLAAEISARSGGRGYAQDYMRRGLAADTAMQLGDIDEAIARMNQGLALGRTSARTNVLGSLAQSHLGQATDFYDLLMGESSLLAGHPYMQKSEHDYSGLYSLLGSALGAAGTAIGLGFGAGGGGSGGGGGGSTGSGF